MREFKVFVSEREVTVISGCAPDFVTQVKGRALAIIPDVRENVDLTVIDIGTEVIDRKSAIEAMELYLSKACAYPFCSPEIMLFGKRENINVTDAKGTKNIKNLKKCKQLYTNTVVMQDLIELKLTTLVYENKVARVYECADAQSCGGDLLKLLLTAPGLPYADVSLIMSQGGGRAFYPESTEAEFIEGVVSDYNMRAREF